MFFVLFCSSFYTFYYGEFQTNMKTVAKWIPILPSSSFNSYPFITNFVSSRNYAPPAFFWSNPRHHIISSSNISVWISNHNTVISHMNIFDVFQRGTSHDYSLKWTNINVFLKQKVLFLVAKLTSHRGLKNALSAFIWSFYDARSQKSLEKEPFKYLYVFFFSKSLTA